MAAASSLAAISWLARATALPWPERRASRRRMMASRATGFRWLNASSSSSVQIRWEAVEAVVGEDARHFDRVGEVGIARSSRLRAVHAHGVDVRPVQQRLVRARVIGLDAVDQLILPQELAALGLGVGLGLAPRGRDRNR